MLFPERVGGTIEPLNSTIEHGTPLTTYPPRIETRSSMSSTGSLETPERDRSTLPEAKRLRVVLALEGIAAASFEERSTTASPLRQFYPMPQLAQRLLQVLPVAF